MNIVEKLMAVDAKVVNEKKTEIFKSERLARLLGEEDHVEIEVRELPYRQVSEIMGSMLTSKGNVDFKKKVDAELRLIISSVNIDFKNKALQEKFGCATPKDLAEKIIGSEIQAIADIVTELSGYNSDVDEDEEIKN